MGEKYGRREGGKGREGGREVELAGRGAYFPSVSS